ncbi:hypothetical protein [Ammoniphilus sp. CFH 90114]|uniref:hypothetical protein n=1 Tax=Ammoniphilus sp. CFH 90114 TaxID=2493665 RepID=UPI0013E981A9|nr:hypothetical protein [Ammoniphilus sp. CFH 90114]
MELHIYVAEKTCEQQQREWEKMTRIAWNLNNENAKKVDWTKGLLKLIQLIR